MNSQLSLHYGRFCLEVGRVQGYHYFVSVDKQNCTFLAHYRLRQQVIRWQIQDASKNLVLLG